MEGLREFQLVQYTRLSNDRKRGLISPILRRFQAIRRILRVAGIQGNSTGLVFSCQSYHFLNSYVRLVENRFADGRVTVASPVQSVVLGIERKSFHHALLFRNDLP